MVQVINDAIRIDNPSEKNKKKLNKNKYSRELIMKNPKKINDKLKRKMQLKFQPKDKKKKEM